MRVEINENNRWHLTTTYDSNGNMQQQWVDKWRQPKEQEKPIRNPGVQYPQDDEDDFGLRRNC